MASRYSGDIGNKGASTGLKVSDERKPANYQSNPLALTSQTGPLGLVERVFQYRGQFLIELQKEYSMKTKNHSTGLTMSDTQIMVPNEP